MVVINMGGKKNEDLSFEQAIRELEQIVSSLEAGDIPLEKALDLFKRGISLTQVCNEKLTHAQGVVKQLYKDSDDKLLEIDFDINSKELP